MTCRKRLVLIFVLVFVFIFSISLIGSGKKPVHGLDFFDLYQFSLSDYTISVSYMVAYSFLKAYVAFLLIKTLSNINLLNPFKIEVARILEKISHVLVGISIVAILYNAHSKWLLKRSYSGKMACKRIGFYDLLVFVITQVFKRGVEIQSENELTV
ncbi:MAG: hypothetical protein ACXWV9_05135 [Flavisolibacter sp.]